MTATDPDRNRLLAPPAIAAGAFALVAAVLGWHWAHRPRPAVATAAAATVAPLTPDTARLEISVLEVKRLPAPVAIAPPVRDPAPAVDPAPPTPAPPAAQNRTLLRSKKPAHATGNHGEAPDVRPADPAASKPPTKPDPQRPAIEANPYLYK